MHRMVEQSVSQASVTTRDHRRITTDVIVPQALQMDCALMDGTTRQMHILRSTAWIVLSIWEDTAT
jgi:hypothetical protein